MLQKTKQPSSFFLLISNEHLAWNILRARDKKTDQCIPTYGLKFLKAIFLSLCRAEEERTLLFSSSFQF